MQTLVFATNNTHKVNEIRTVIGNQFSIVTLKEAGIEIDIPEPFDTLAANASHKCKTIYELTGKDCFSEDTGLEVEAINGEPGVKSARYAGDDRNFNSNIEKLLFRLGNNPNKKAQFRTVISLRINNSEYLFEGICTGEIITTLKGTEGFGYDPIFIPTGSNRTFAEMSMEEKNLYSHRRKATDQLIDFLSRFGTK